MATTLRPLIRWQNPYTKLSSTGRELFISAIKNDDLFCGTPTIKKKTSEPRSEADDDPVFILKKKCYIFFCMSNIFGFKWLWQCFVDGNALYVFWASFSIRIFEKILRIRGATCILVQVGKNFGWFTDLACKSIGIPVCRTGDRIGLHRISLNQLIFFAYLH